MAEPARGLTVAVTGPTGDVGVAAVGALERSKGVARIRGMARREFDPAEHGWKKTDYVRGDVRDRSAVEAFVKDADVVVHLAFIIMGSDDESARVNSEGSRNVFEAAVAAGAKRLVYTSSVAAYGFRDDHPATLTEDRPAVGSDHPYARQKAEMEALLGEVTAGSDTDVYVFRPCLVAGPTALQMVEEVPAAIRRLARIKGIQPVVPDPGVPLQLVHEEDLATAIRAAVLGKGSPGVYNLAGEGVVSLSDIARAYGWRSVGVPRGAVKFASGLFARLSFLPSKARWVDAVRSPMVMDTAKARKDSRGSRSTTRGRRCTRRSSPRASAACSGKGGG